jgi:hypothetical protein
MDIDSRSLQLLLEVGLLAGGYGWMKEAEVIFEGLRAVRPENESPLIGLAIAKMNNNQAEESIRILETEALNTNPESDLARAFLGLALKLAGRVEQSRLLSEQVVGRNRDQAAVNLAKGILEEIHPV